MKKQSKREISGAASRRARAPVHPGAHGTLGASALVQTQEHAKDRPEARARTTFPVVGVGSSAGGVEALQAFFRALPRGDGMTFVVVSHLDPGRESHLTEILDRIAPLPVIEARDETAIEPDHIYVLCPDRWMTIRDGTLHLVRSLQAHGRPIDHFLKSLANECGRNAIGVILSGTGTDGTAGVRAIKAKGGVALVQKPETAAFDGMPANAIASGQADEVLAPEEIARVLPRYTQNPSDRPRARGDSMVEPLEDVAALLDANSREGFAHYRRPPLERAVHRRMGARGVTSLDEYVRLLRTDAGEVQLLARDLLVTVTGFFRDPPAWDSLREKVLEPLVRERSQDRPIRVWVTGCSTGEEAYSVAMLLSEEMEVQGKQVAVKVFATDVAEDALARGRAGIYDASAVKELPPERLARLFVREGDTYQVVKRIREMVIFARHDLLRDPPFSRLDLLTCRNLLIYLDASVQARLIELLHFSLSEGGYLSLGSSEGLGPTGERRFESVDQRWRIYRKLGPARHDLAVLPLARDDDEAEAIGHLLRARAPAPAAHLLRQALAERFAPASVLIDDRYRVHYFHGATGDFLVQPPGAPTDDLLSMLREGLRDPVRFAVRRAAEHRIPLSVVANRATLSRGRRSPVLVNVIPVGERESTLYVVSFEAEAGRPGGPAGGVVDLPAEQLYEELRRTQDELCSTIDRLEISNEDLRSSNEEITTINEELHATNEELETSRQDLQSMNQELQALNEQLAGVNAQLEQKIAELETTGNDLSNLLHSTDIGTLFLDRECRVRSFTSAIHRLFELRREDVGRPIDHFARKFDGAVTEDARNVLATLEPSETEVRNDAGSWFLRRIVPYRTENGRVDGVVITFTDITLRRAAEESLRRVNEGLEQQVAQRTALGRLLQDVAMIANSPMPLEQAVEATLDRICRNKAWLAGHAYLVLDGEAEDVGIWHVRPPLDRAAVRDTIGERSFGSGEGLVGSVLDTGEPRWTSDLAMDARFRRSGARALGVRSALAFPVLVGERVGAVLEFFSGEEAEPDPRLLDVMRNVGTQLGRVIEREEMRHRMIELAVEEQRSLGEELHDTLSQQIHGLAMLGQSLSQTLVASGSGDQRVRMLVEGLQHAHRQIRVLASGLVPVRIEAGGLTGALQEMAREWEQMHGTACSFAGDAAADPGDQRVATALYRIAREAARNAVTHGQAKRIEIGLAGSGTGIELEVRDDGCGMAEVPAHGPGMGLQIMRHRADLVGGQLDIQSEPGRTTVRCRIPLAALLGMGGDHGA